MAALCLIAWAGLARADDAADYAWSQHPGAALRLDAALRDEAGRPISLGAVLGRVPAVLDLDYYHCPSLCGVVRADAYAALATSGLVLGRDVIFISLSIDPAETPEDASRAREADIARARLPTEDGLHYLTGAPASLADIERAVGFRKRYDNVLKQYLHPAGIVVLTKSGRISTYVMGVGYSGGDLRAAVFRAREGGTARAALPILLLCFHYDSTTGRYTLAIEKVLRLAAGLTVMTLGGFLIILHRARHKHD